MWVFLSLTLKYQYQIYSYYTITVFNSCLTFLTEYAFLALCACITHIFEDNWPYEAVKVTKNPTAFFRIFHIFLLQRVTPLLIPRFEIFQLQTHVIRIPAGKSCRASREALSEYPEIQELPSFYMLQYSNSLAHKLNQFMFTYIYTDLWLQKTINR